MKSHRRRSSAWLDLLLAAAMLFACRGALAQEGCASAQCHATLLKAKTVHPATESCESCHESVATPHPQKGKQTFKLSAEPPGLCEGCHEPFGKIAQVHPPAGEGMCTACHDPHASNQPNLLVEPGVPQLCYQCHDQVGEKIAKGPTVHAAVQDGDRCITCHNPHASDHPALMDVPQETACLACHPAIVTKSMTLLHGPIQQGECTPCHDPHASRYPRLLVLEFPAGPYAPYTDQQYELCFSCHQRDMVQVADTTTATAFRDGAENLHFLHVNNKQKGRSCALCHTLHGSYTPELVAQSVTFGKWSLPIKFVKTETGGSCAPGCHRPLSYDRKSPGKKPALPKPAAKSG
jgi:predicted CXXCH cytochrome family protein